MKKFAAMGLTLLIIGCGNIALDNEVRVSDFNSCVEAGNPVMESYPEQCTHKGETYTNQDQIMVGGDRDEHGCIGSAGYVWNESKQECVRPWEEEKEEARTNVPENCEVWFDGCNNCKVGPNKELGCTRMFCPPEAMTRPECKKFHDVVDSPEQETPEPELQICTMEYAPVCGVDGVTYGNACSAGKTEVSHEGECE